MRYSAIQARFFNSLWALRPEDHHFIGDLILRRSAGETVTQDEIRAALEGKTYGSPVSRPAADSIAVLGLHGTILNRAGMMQVSGFTSPQEFAAAIRQAANDPSVAHIVISVDSPGGTVDGTNTAAEAVRYAVSKKPVTAVADGMMASGAYWIASQASRIVTDPTAQVGSIGVIATHVDQTKVAEKEGVRVTYFRSVEHKALGQPYEPLSEAGSSDFVDLVNAAHREFVAAIEAKRGPLSEAAQSGRVFTGIEAVAAGLADEVGTLQGVLDELTQPGKGKSKARAEAPTPPRQEVKPFGAAASAAGRTNVDQEAIRQALGLPETATTEEVATAIQALARDREDLAAIAGERDAAKAELLRQARTALAQRLVVGSNVHDEHLLGKATEAAVDAASDEEAETKVNALIGFARERVMAHEEAAQAKREAQDISRRRMAQAMVQQAALKPVGQVRDQQFLDRCEAAAVATQDDASARVAVQELIDDRRDILAGAGAAETDLTAVREDRDKAKGELQRQARTGMAQSIVNRSGLDDEKLMARAVHASVNAGSDDEAKAEVEAMVSIAREKADAQAEARQARAEVTASARELLATKMVHDANLPAAAPERDAQFLARCISLAQKAEDDTTARQAVSAEIEERRDLLSIRHKAAPPSGDNSATPPQEADPGIRRVRAGLGL